MNEWFPKRVGVEAFFSLFRPRWDLGHIKQRNGQKNYIIRIEKSIKKRNALVKTHDMAPKKTQLLKCECSWRRRRKGEMRKKAKEKSFLFFSLVKLPCFILLNNKMCVHMNLLKGGSMTIWAYRKWKKFAECLRSRCQNKSERT